MNTQVSTVPRKYSSAPKTLNFVRLLDRVVPPENSYLLEHNNLEQRTARMVKIFSLTPEALLIGAFLKSWLEIPIG